MAILAPVKKLFIPGKNMPKWAQPGYGTDMRAIENYINNLATGGISEITSLDGSVTITDATGPTVDLSVPPSGEIWHATMGSPLQPYIGGGIQGAGTDMILASSDQDVRSFSIGPIFSVSGILISQTNFNINPFAGSGTVTLNFATIVISDATMTNQLVLSNSGVSLNLFGGSYVGWTSSRTGTVLNLGSPQTTHLVTSTSNTTPFWVNFFYNVSSSGLS